MIPVPEKGQFSRRRFLELGASVAGGVVFAACGQPSLAAAAATAPDANVVERIVGQVVAQQASAVKLQMWKAPHKPAGEEIKIAEKVLASLHDAIPGVQVEYTEVPWLKYAEQPQGCFRVEHNPRHHLSD